MTSRATAYTTAAAAALLGISERTVRHHVQRLGLGWRTGRDIVLSPADLALIRTRRGKVGRPKHPR
jgi:predicted ArsR family transcriptional regulator